MSGHGTERSRATRGTAKAGIVLAMLGACMAFGQPAQAAVRPFSVTYDGNTTTFIPRGGSIAVEVSGFALSKWFGGKGTTRGFHKVVMVGGNGGRGCANFISADGGVSFTDQACVSLAGSAQTFVVTITHAIHNPNERETAKEFPDATKRSSVVLSVNASGGGCAARVVRGQDVTVRGARRSLSRGSATCRLL